METVADFITIESALARVLQCNRDILDALDLLKKADLQVSNENAFFSWEVAPNGIFGYTNRPKKHNDSDLSYGLGLSLTKKFTYGTKVYLGPSVTKKGHGYQADLSATIVQPLFKGIAKSYVLSRLYGAKYSRRSAYRLFFMKQIKIIQETIRKLYNVVKQEEIARLNEEAVNRLFRLVKTAQLKESIGLATSADVYRAEHELRNAEERLSSSALQISDAKANVKEILALSESEDIYVNVPIKELFDDFPITEVLETSLANRIEIDQAYDTLQEAKRLCQVDKHDFLPEVNLVADFTNFSYYDSFRVVDPDNYEKYWKVGLTASKPLNQTTSLNRLELSHLAINASKRNIERVKDQIIREVTKTHRSYESLKKKIEIQKSQVELSEVSLNLSSLKFNRGLADNFDLIEAEKNLQNAKIRLFTQIVDHMIEFLSLRVAMGTFCEKPQIPY